MAYSTQRATSTGSLASLDLSILYLARTDISVFYNSIPAAPGTWAWVGTTDKRITFSPPIANGVQVLVKRTTRIDRQINVFASGAKFNNATMDTNFTQVIYLNQEAVEGGQLSDVFNQLDMHGNKIVNLGNATANGDAVNYGQVLTMSNGAYQSSLAAAQSAADALAAKTLAQAWASQLTTTVDGTNYSAKQYALNAGISAAAALGSQNAAAASASSASGSAATATTQAGIATTKATEAAASDTHATAIAADVLNIQQNASDALTAANAAVVTANGVDAKATTALSNSSAAVTTANAAAAQAALTGATLVATATTTAVATLNFDAVFTGTYNSYLVVLENIKTTVATDIAFFFRRAGANVSATPTGYCWIYTPKGVGAVSSLASNNGTYFPLIASAEQAIGSQRGSSGEVHVIAPQNTTTYKTILSRFFCSAAGNKSVDGQGHYFGDSLANDGFGMTASGSTFVAGGIIKVYGLKA